MIAGIQVKELEDYNENLEAGNAIATDNTRKTDPQPALENHDTTKIQFQDNARLSQSTSIMKLKEQHSHLVVPIAEEVNEEDEDTMHNSKLT